MSLYLKYFNDIQITPTSFKQIAFNQVQYADACNFNNVYICAVPRASLFSSLNYLLPAQKEKILNSLAPVKMLTNEVNFLDPVFKALAIGVESNLVGSEFRVEDRDFCRVELVKTPGNTRTNESIIADVANLMQLSFNNEIQTLGSTFNLANLIGEMLRVDGISEINTVRLDTGERVSGISFFMWNPSYPELDRQVVRNNVVLKPFEFLYFERLANISEKFFVTESATGNVRV
jgi:hypothetical protein